MFFNLSIPFWKKFHYIIYFSFVNTKININSLYFTIFYTWGRGSIYYTAPRVQMDYTIVFFIKNGKNEKLTISIYFLFASRRTRHYRYIQTKSKLKICKIQSFQNRYEHFKTIGIYSSVVFFHIYAAPKSSERRNHPWASSSAWCFWASTFPSTAMDWTLSTYPCCPPWPIW